MTRVVRMLYVMKENDCFLSSPYQILLSAKNNNKNRQCKMLAHASFHFQVLTLYLNIMSPVESNKIMSVLAIKSREPLKCFLDLLSQNSFI